MSDLYHTGTVCCRTGSTLADRLEQVTVTNAGVGLLFIDFERQRRMRCP